MKTRKVGSMKEERGLTLFFNKLFCKSLVIVLSGFLTTKSIGQDVNQQQDIGKSNEQTLQQKLTQQKEGNTVTNEEKLNAIREILISEALKAKAKVRSSSWIDTDGSLHENLYVLSEGYNSGDGTYRGSIDEQDFNINRLGSSKKAKYCRFSNPLYARVAELAVSVGRSSLELPYNDLDAIRNTVQNLYKNGISSHQNWIFLERRPIYKTSYERFLSKSSLNKAQYKIEIQIQPIEKFSFRKKRNHVELKLVMKILSLNGQKIVLSSEKFLPSPWADPPPEVPRSGLAQIAYAIYEANQIGKFETNSQKSFSSHFEMGLVKKVSEIVKETILAFDCRQILFPISEIINDTIYIDAGYERGLKLGDQMLLTDSEMIPHRILEESAIEKIALVEIKSVSPYRAEARRIAGPDLGPVTKRGRTNIIVTPF